MGVEVVQDEHDALGLGAGAGSIQSTSGRNDAPRTASDRHDVATPPGGATWPTKVFDGPAYFAAEGVEGWARLKVRAIVYDISVVRGSTITVISSVDDVISSVDDVIAYLLEDTLSGTTKLIDRELRMRS